MLTRQWFAANKPDVEVIVPQLPDDPTEISDTITQLIEAAIFQPSPSNVAVPSEALFLMGSSMGGFFANYFAELYACKAVLINPVVYPHIMLGDHLGDHRNPYTGVEYSLEKGMIAPLQKQLIASMRDPKKRLVMLQTGDEVLDFREAESFYADSNLFVETGGDHSFVGFESWLPRIANFLGV